MKKIHLSNDKRLVVKSGKNFKLKNFDTRLSTDIISKDGAEAVKQYIIEEISKLQDVLYASDKHSVLLVFQARDAAGKDSTVKHVMSGVNPAGCQVISFKSPSSKELDHDFLWRTTVALPEKGNIGIYNRSYYEEVIVTKVHPEIILNQKIADVNTVDDIDDKFWAKRYESIRNFEKHLCNNGFVILKFFLNVSKEEQKNRFIERINNPSKQWKFEYNDINERKYWKEYHAAFEQMIQETATEQAPWHIIPADKKWFMQYAVSQLLLEALTSLDLKYPRLLKKQADMLKKAKEELENEK
jgi:PPK2 family polyphosphate:nucleotide phosphotransferase